MSNIEIPHGHKFDSGKPRFELLPVAAIRLAAAIMTGGASKYNENNWTGLSASRIVGAASRHLQYFLAGQDLDNDSTQHHIGHYLANLMMLHHILNHFPAQDDRMGIKASPSPEIDKHIYKESRKHTTVPQYTLLPPDSLFTAARVFTELTKDKTDHYWIGTLSNKTLVELASHNFMAVMAGETIDLGEAIAYTMMLVHHINHNITDDDRIFTYVNN